MAALVTLSTAKTHLRVEDDDHDGDIYATVIAASDIILNYLKARTNTIASISVANPTVITTETPHSLTTGASVPIAGTSTTPTVNGTQTVTVTGSTTFTVPVNVTVGQSVVAGTVGPPVWTDATVPGRVQQSVLLMLTHLYEHRGDDMGGDASTWDAIERLLIRSRDPALA